MAGSASNGRMPVVCVVGPTASGKTALGAALARKYGGEVISADSMQIYRGMEIASAAPTEEETLGVRHHLVGALGLDERFSVADFCEAAERTARDIFSRGKLPFIVGGTGLYIDSFINGISFAACDTDLELRARLVKELEEKGGAFMLGELANTDPETAASLHPNDGKRIVRALEVYLTTGVTASEQNRRSRPEAPRYDALKIGLFPRDRQFLYDRIDARVTRMAADGLIEEAKKCLGRGDTAAQAIGHKELIPYFEGKISLEEALDDLRRQTRRYAKRQLTWFRRDESIVPVYIDDHNDFDSLFAQADGIVGRFLSSRTDGAAEVKESIET